MRRVPTSEVLTTPESKSYMRRTGSGASVRPLGSYRTGGFACGSGCMVSEQREDFASIPNWGWDAPEVARVSGDQVVCPYLEGSRSLNGILEIAETENQGLLKVCVSKRNNVQNAEQVTHRCFCRLTAFLLRHNVEDRRNGMPCNVPLEVALLGTGKQLCCLPRPRCAGQHHIEHDVDVQEEPQRPYFSDR